MSTIWTPGGEHPVEREPPQAPERDRAEGAADQDEGAGPGVDPTTAAEVEQELAAMQQELASAPAAAVVANHAIGLFQLAAIHLGRQPPNLEESRLAIDAMAALVERLAGRLGPDEQTLRDGLAQIQLAYVQLAQATAPSEGALAEVPWTPR